MKKNHIPLIFLFAICELTSAQNITAKFSFDTVCGGDTTCFHDLSTSSNGPIVAWNWNFGDPSGINISNLQNPCHIYSSAGTYTVTLIATNSNGNQSTVTHQVIINLLPIAAFSTSTDGDTTFFQDYWQSGPSLCSFFWDFGDGYTSTLQNPYHIYSTNGTYTICLTVTTCNSCSATGCHQVNIATEINEIENSSSIIIFPNPSYGLFRVQSSGFNIQDLKVYNLIGELVFQTKPNSQFETLNFDLPEGIYYMHLQTNTKSIVKKLIAQK